MFRPPPQCSLSGCAGRSNRFVGRWQKTTGDNGAKQAVLEFRRDGTASLDGEEVSYKILDNKLEIRRGFYYYEVAYEFDGSKKLTLTADDVAYSLTGNYEKLKK